MKQRGVFKHGSQKVWKIVFGRRYADIFSGGTYDPLWQLFGNNRELYFCGGTLRDNLRHLRRHRTRTLRSAGA
jgi:hypothetical protein